jgi:Holliday junction resolvase RusA-like endonuclease
MPQVQTISGAASTPHQSVQDGASFSVTCDLPPSTNKLYQRVRGGRVVLTKEARVFRERLHEKMVAELPKLSSFPVGPEVLYRFDTILFFQSLENRGWGQFYTKGDNKGKRKAATRYKKIDVDNRVKFLQDSVMTSLGVDDSQVFVGYQEKHEDSVRPRAEVKLVVVPRDRFFQKERKW